MEIAEYYIGTDLSGFKKDLSYEIYKNGEDSECWQVLNYYDDKDNIIAYDKIVMIAKTGYRNILRSTGEVKC